jgi:uncharacterized protein
MKTAGASEPNAMGARGSNLPRAAARIAAGAVAGALDLYHLLIAPFLTIHSGTGCRFEPSCSCYARSALLRFGLWRGGYLSARRLARCRPWGGHGYDPVPQTLPARNQGHPGRTAPLSEHPRIRKVGAGNH